MLCVLTSLLSVASTCLFMDVENNLSAEKCTKGHSLMLINYFHKVMEIPTPMTKNRAASPFCNECPHCSGVSYFSDHCFCAIISVFNTRGGVY